MALEKYNEKRDFKKTQEPKGIKIESNGELRFVIQKHEASHLHYDFRLEIDGVLASWAVPKGPSANPKDKRLAMHVEDHPMDYIDFEGTIPKGEYGGGTVMVWDFGIYQPEGNDDRSKDTSVMKKQLTDGSIKVQLSGSKVKGGWHLVKMKGDNDQWLLMKSKDEHSGNDIVFDPNSILSNRDFIAIAKSEEVWTNKKGNLKTSQHSEKTASAKVNSPKSKVKKIAGEMEEFSAEDLIDAIKIDEFPKQWRPQLATLADKAFDNDDWIFETKFDGYRALAQINDSTTTLLSRNGVSFNEKFSELVKTLNTVENDMILDGEIVIEEKGRSHFQWLQNHKENLKRGTLKYYVFDILFFQGYDLRKLTLLQRKKILKAILPKLKNIVYSEHTIGKGKLAFQQAEKDEGEGIIAKKASSKYYTDKRSKDWLKIKTEMQQEMVIGGFTEPQGSRVGIGALLCGYYKGKNLVFSGKVGSGFTDEILQELRKKFNKLERKTCPFAETPKESNVHWVKPELIAQIKFSEFTETGSMRHPVYLGLRADKKATDVTIEKYEVETESVASKTQKVRINNKEKSKTKIVDISTNMLTPKSGMKEGRVEFSNTDKIFFPKQKITKGDVIAYYDSVADYILPYLKDRPESLRRTPDGITKEGFFQKNVAGAVPKWIKTRKIKSDSKEDSIEYLLCQDKETLLFLANYGCIELNPWSSRVGSLNNPDYIIFDLDPKDAPMKNIVKTALKTKEILDLLKVPAFIKTSGGNGLHVFIPVKPKYTYEHTRNFSHLVSQMIHRDLPDITSLERMPNKRKGKVYLDFLQNGKGKTMASIYSLRPRDGAGISTPLEWNEVNDDLDLMAFNLKTIPKRLEEKGDLWKDFFKSAIDLKNILKGLE